VLDRFAVEKPEAVFAVFEDGETWSFAETRRRTRRLGAALQALGIGQGDHVVAWLPNGKAALAANFAINYIVAAIAKLHDADITLADNAPGIRVEITFVAH
jgi:crotonobetaine/carnitine-CoA ligase